MDATLQIGPNGTLDVKVKSIPVNPTDHLSQVEITFDGHAIRLLVWGTPEEQASALLKIATALLAHRARIPGREPVGITPRTYEGMEASEPVEAAFWANRLGHGPDCQFCANDAEQCHASLDCEARAMGNGYCFGHRAVRLLDRTTSGDEPVGGLAQFQEEDR